MGDPTTNSDDFKGALAAWPSGVSVVTSRHEGLGYGLTVSAFSSVSLEPPLIMVCLKSTNCLTQLISDAGSFAVSILAAEQDGVSTYFASSGREPAVDLGGAVAVTEGLASPLIAGAAAHLECRLHSATPAGDHTIVVGAVQRCASMADAQPLVYWNRAYRRVAVAPSAG